MPKYVELTAEDLQEAWQKRPLAILPMGALEWHGAHLPLGLDGLVAEWFCEQLEEATGGVLLPTLYAPITTLPHWSSQQVTTQVASELWEQIVLGVHQSGARHVLIVTGHYAQGHMMELYRLAMRTMHTNRTLKVLAASPLELLGDPKMLDHAGEWEASQLMSIRPELVQLQKLPREVTPHQAGVLGESPLRAKRVKGHQALIKALEQWVAAANRMRTDGDRGWLFEHAEAGSAGIEEYVKQWHDDSWEQAIVDWWKAKGEPSG